MSVFRNREGPRDPESSRPGEASSTRGMSVAQGVRNNGGPGNPLLPQKLEAGHYHLEKHILLAQAPLEFMALRVLLRFLEALEGLRHDDEEPAVPPLLPLGFHHHLGVGLLDVRTKAERDSAPQPALFPYTGIEEMTEQRHRRHHPDERLTGVGKDGQI